MENRSTDEVVMLNETACCCSTANRPSATESGSPTKSYPQTSQDGWQHGKHENELDKPLCSENSRKTLSFLLYIFEIEMSPNLN